MQSRFKSKAAWAATIALILFIAKNYFNIEIPKVDELLNLILIELSVLGIFNNPTDSENY